MIEHEPNLEEIEDFGVKKETRHHKRVVNLALTGIAAGIVILTGLHAMDDRHPFVPSSYQVEKGSAVK